MVELLIGIVLGFLTVFAGKVTGFEIDRSFYPVMLIVIALYYVLFAFQSSDKVEILFEVAIALLFSALAVWGHRKGLIIVVLGLVLHGIYDLVQSNIELSTDPPEWWTMFCLGYDFTLAMGLTVTTYTFRKRHFRI
ncbi:hypothetical protein [Maribacter polysaccharolyticus]|uniref:hypothetical protein n=1 Tax=Maribacter polysaccharolyticus TaxID=3020831 RepID=UPI00237F832C|nr:hypothetical protein [Maribacter polysaccharolyticus]MDE3741102.1 hypothetical protein [Maribacter polysaccharolyticus]